MAENKDFVEIGVDAYLPEDMRNFIRDNPIGLTKEGVLEEIENWKLSRNRVQSKMYESMLKYGKSLKPSGFTKSGDIILARRDGKVTWYKKTPTKE